MKAINGVKESYKLQRMLLPDNEAVVRGLRSDETPQALNAYLYSIVRGNRHYRRGLLQSLLKLFDESSVSIFLYICQ